MYEEQTFEVILNRMLDKIPSNMDKREGSIIYDAIAPAAIELALMYIEFDFLLNQTFADTSSREYLIKRALERGIKPYPATNSILRGVFNMNIEIGSRFTCGDLSYVATEKITENEFKMKCETAGTIGNKNLGTLIPINYIDGLTSAELTEILIYGEDEEETEDLRNRYFETFESQAFGGNIKDYQDKTNAIAGVGATKVTPIWNGGGTVKLTILNSEFGKASDTLISLVQQTIDPTQDGQGVGLAPIGHVVTVDTATEITVNVSTSITFESGYTFEGLKTQIEKSINDYLLEIKKVWVDNDTSVVRIAQIDSRIVGIVGVADIQNTKINNTTTNLTLTKYQIPKLGVVTNA